MKLNHKFALLLAGAVLAGSLTGCGASGTPASSAASSEAAASAAVSEATSEPAAEATLPDGVYTADFASDASANRFPSGLAEITWLISAICRCRLLICCSRVMVMPTFNSAHFPLSHQDMIVRRLTPTFSAISAWVKSSRIYRTLAHSLFC